MNADTAELPRLALGAPDTGCAQTGDFTSPCAPANTHGLWAMIEPGLWVGNAGGSYIGMIERSPHGFVASDDRGTFLGHFALLADAKIALAARHADPAVAPAPGAAAPGAAAADRHGRPPA